MSTLKTTRIETTSGDGVDVIGLSKVEDTGKNICTAWVAFDGEAVPPNIFDSYNVSSVVRIDVGTYSINFTEPMDNINYSIGMSCGSDSEDYPLKHININGSPIIGSVSVVTGDGSSESSEQDMNYVHVQIFGGKA